VDWPQEHAWLLLDSQILDPTLPEADLHYFPAHQWSGDDFQRIYFQYEDKPYFRHIEFMNQGVQVEMDRARRKADELAAAWRVA
jgi:hypothetical protein